MVDRKIAKCIRRVDPLTGRIEFHLPAGGLAFATYEHEPVVLQLGTGTSQLHTYTHGDHADMPMVMVCNGI